MWLLGEASKRISCGYGGGNRYCQRNKLHFFGFLCENVPMFWSVLLSAGKEDEYFGTYRLGLVLNA